MIASEVMSFTRTENVKGLLEKYDILLPSRINKLSSPLPWIPFCLSRLPDRLRTKFDEIITYITCIVLIEAATGTLRHGFKRAGTPMESVCKVSNNIQDKRTIKIAT